VRESRLTNILKLRGTIPPLRSADGRPEVAGSRATEKDEGSVWGARESGEGGAGARQQ
jgi:hypothetical protein